MTASSSLIRRKTMSGKYVTSSGVRRMVGTGLIIAAAAIPVQIAGGADYPTVPPGLLILAAAAAMVLFAPWRWALIVAMLAAVFLGIGGTIAPNFRDQLTDPGQTMTFLGSIMQVIGLLIALVSCPIAIGQTPSGPLTRGTKTRSGTEAKESRLKINRPRSGSAG
jgi:hypothetical protein